MSLRSVRGFLLDRSSSASARSVFIGVHLWLTESFRLRRRSGLDEFVAGFELESTALSRRVIGHGETLV
jgi:hypothetical protein